MSDHRSKAEECIKQANRVHLAPDGVSGSAVVEVAKLRLGLGIIHALLHLAEVLEDFAVRMSR